MFVFDYEFCSCAKNILLTQVFEDVFLFSYINVKILKSTWKSKNNEQVSFP